MPLRSMKTNRLHTESTQLSARWRAPVSTGGRVRRAWTFRGGKWHGPSMWLRTVLGLNLENGLRALVDLRETGAACVDNTSGEIAWGDA